MSAPDDGYFAVAVYETMACNNSGVLSMTDKKRGEVLIIDDNNISRMLLRSMLRGDEYEVVGEASNGKSGIELALRLRPDIICLDIMMPEISGLDVLLEIRPKLPQAVILMVTGSTDRETVQAALQGGANGYIVKPYNSGRVLTAIEQALAKARSQKVQAGA